MLQLIIIFYQAINIHYCSFIVNQSQYKIYTSVSYFAVSRSKKNYAIFKYPTFKAIMYKIKYFISNIWLSLNK
jgi:hypothetical protein